MREGREGSEHFNYIASNLLTLVSVYLELEVSINSLRVFAFLHVLRPSSADEG